MKGNGIDGPKQPPIDDFNTFTGTTNNKQMGSNGDFKQRRVSKAKEAFKYIQHLGSKGLADYLAKRTEQASIADRRIDTLSSLQSPKAIADNLDGTDSNSQSKASQIDASTQLLQNLQKVSKDVDIDKSTYLPREPHGFLVMSKKGRIKRAQADNTIYLRETIAAIKTPQGLRSTLTTIAEARKQDLISEKQEKSLLQEQLVALQQECLSIPEGTKEKKRQAYTDRLYKAHALTMAMKKAGGSAMEGIGPSGKDPARKDIRDLALDTYMLRTGELQAHPTSLQQTREQLEESHALLEGPIKEILNATSKKDGRSVELLSIAKGNAEIDHARLQTVIDRIRNDHNELQELLNGAIPSGRKECAQLEVALLDLQEQRRLAFNNKNKREQKNLNDKIQKLKPRINKANEGLTVHLNHAFNLNTQLNTQKAQFTDWETYHSPKGTGGALPQPIPPKPSSYRDQLSFADTYFSEDQKTEATRILYEIDQKKYPNEGGDHEQQLKAEARGNYAFNHLRDLVAQEVKPETALKILRMSHKYNQMLNKREKQNPKKNSQIKHINLHNALWTVGQYLDIPTPDYNPDAKQSSDSWSPPNKADRFNVPIQPAGKPDDTVEGV